MTGGISSTSECPKTQEECRRIIGIRKETILVDWLINNDNIYKEYVEVYERFLYITFSVQYKTDGDQITL